MSRLWPRLGPLLLLGLALAAGLVFGYREAFGPFGQAVVEDASQQVRGGMTVGQTFRAAFDRLDRIDVYLGAAPAGQANSKDVILHVRTAPDATADLRSVVVSGSSVKSDGWVRFDFAAIPDSGGKGYYLLLESPASTTGDALRAARSLQDRYRDGAYYLNGAPAGGDLAFQVYSEPGPLAWARGLAGLLAQDRPSIWGEPALYAVLFVAFLALLGAAGVALAGATDGEDGP